jgi:Kef-type K+ transport system membrane component KefB
MAVPVLLVVQVVAIVAVARLVGILFRRIGQPRVVGEMAAGILLGPSLLGWLAPALSATLFPPASLALLNALSQFGLLLFMFLIGLELDLKQLRALGRTAVATSLVSIAAPFALGALLALWLHPRVSDPSVGVAAFVLFMSIAMSITAFPVLARILAERDLLRTRVGGLAITCAAVDDVVAWTVLAAIIVMVRATGSPRPLALPVHATVAGLVAFVAAMVLVVRPALRRLATALERSGWHQIGGFAVALALAFGAGWVTDALGVHAIFGAFLAGVVMPRDDRLALTLVRRLEAPIVVVLLPLYFAFTGLRSSFLLIHGGSMWLYFAAILAVAVAGKFGGATVTARMGGMAWREAAAVGVLMNTRGLVELIILNLGLDLGVLAPPLFSALVLMALVTTGMTSPLLALIDPHGAERRRAAKAAVAQPPAPATPIRQ